MNWQITSPVNTSLKFQIQPINSSSQQVTSNQSISLLSLETAKENGMKLPSQQDLISLFNSFTATNNSILQTLKPLSYENRIKLQNMCMKKFENLPIFLLYEISTELSLSQLHQLCNSKLIEQNYEQFNYLKMDLLKISLNSFHKIFQQYYEHVNSLEIQGLRVNDIKSVISDYCLINSIHDQPKQTLMKKYAQGKGITFGVSKGLTVGVACQKQVRRSMIQTRKGGAQILTPMRVKNSVIASSRTPNPIHISSVTQIGEITGNIKRSLRHIKTLKSVSQKQNMRTSKEEAVLIKKQIEQFHKKQSELFQQILETRKSMKENQSQQQIKESLTKLAKSMNQMEIQVSKQNQKLQKLQKSVFEIGRQIICSNKFDSVFRF